MRIGVISDTHIPDRAQKIPKIVLDDFKGADLILHAGDLVCLEILDVLKGISKEVRAVWGNMDPPQVREKLPEKQIIPAENLRIGLIHGNGAPFKLIEQVSNAFKNEKPDIIVFGHAHYPVNEKKHNILFFNPGSSTDKIFSTINSYGILEIDKNKIEAKIIRI